jgi:hypothetical protein
VPLSGLGAVAEWAVDASRGGPLVMGGQGSEVFSIETYDSGSGVFSIETYDSVTSYNDVGEGSFTLPGRVFFLVYTLTRLLTAASGGRSTAAETKSLPYFFSKMSRILLSSGRSEHLGAANLKLQMTSFKSVGHSLKKMIAREIM